jgi:hypothetical protein
MSGAEAGTIIRITNPVNNKIIYAKLLGDMNDKQSQGLNIRISKRSCECARHFRDSEIYCKT